MRPRDYTGVTYRRLPRCTYRTSYPERRDGTVRLRMLSGRPRHLHVFLVSLAVLVLGIATGVGRASRPTASLETEAAASVSTGSDVFVDVPPNPVTTAPPANAPAEPTTTSPSAPA